MMKAFLRDWVIPPRWYRLMQQLARLRSGSIFRKSLSSPELSSFKNRHMGERIFILASGPSINTQNLKPLSGEICISVSQFSLHQDIDIIRPKYHMLAPLHPPFDFETDKKIFQSLKRYTWDYSCFVGTNDFAFSHRNFLAKFPEYQPQHTYYLDYQNSPQINEQNRDCPEIWNPVQLPYTMRTVVFGAIMMAAWMGAEEIILLGCDHDYLRDTSRVENHHFYKERDGFSDKEHLSSFTSEKWFEEYYFRWKQYRLIGEHLALNGQSVINATAGGMLDVFPRKDLQELLRK